MKVPGSHDLQRIVDFLFSSIGEDFSERSTATNLIYFQSMLLMSMAANTTPRGSKSSGGFTAGTWLSMATGLAYNLRLHEKASAEQFDASSDFIDSDDHIGISAYIALMILDKWQAIGVAKPEVLRAPNINLTESLQRLIGRPAWELARRSSCFSFVCISC